jgi:hypothetical protein
LGELLKNSSRNTSLMSAAFLSLRACPGSLSGYV